MNKLWTINEAAERAQVAPVTLEFHIYRRKDLKVVRVGRRVKIENAELERFMAARAQEPELFSVAQLAAVAGVDKSTMQRRLQGVKPAKVFGRKKFYNAESVLPETSKSV